MLGSEAVGSVDSRNLCPPALTAHKALEVEDISSVSEPSSTKMKVGWCQDLDNIPLDTMSRLLMSSFRDTHSIRQLNSDMPKSFSEVEAALRMSDACKFKRGARQIESEVDPIIYQIARQQELESMSTTKGSTSTTKGSTSTTKGSRCTLESDTPRGSGDVRFAGQDSLEDIMIFDSRPFHLRMWNWFTNTCCCCCRLCCFPPRTRRAQQPDAKYFT